MTRQGHEERQPKVGWRSGEWIVIHIYMYIYEQYRYHHEREHHHAHYHSAFIITPRVSIIMRTAIPHSIFKTAGLVARLVVREHIAALHR